MEQLPDDFVHDLNDILEVKLRLDLPTRLLYSTDASLYKINPLGVVFPKSLDELNVIMGFSSYYQVPVLARGSGSSLAGQAIGKALIIDCSRYLDHVIEIIPEENRVLVEPGVILNSLNRKVSKYNLQFGPDPSSAERATIGGSVSNNAAGSHSLLYGMSADHVLSIDTILSDGSQVRFNELPLLDAQKLSSGDTVQANIYKSALQIRERLPEIIDEKWPKTYRTVSGYNLNYLIPWSGSEPPRWQEIFPDLSYPPLNTGNINLAQLLAGSEGTLGIIRSLELRLVPLPRYKLLVVLSYKSIEEACERVPGILEFNPSAVELIPQKIVQLARSIPGYAQNLPKELDSHQALLAVEFAGSDLPALKVKANSLGKRVLIAESQFEQEKIWSIRKVGLGILMSRPGDYKPIPGIEDMSVPVENLGIFIREMDRILKDHNTSSEFYGHASAGCLHVRPILNMKTSAGKEQLRSIGMASVDLAAKMGGSISAEHGDGLARGEWLEMLFGPEILNAFKELKNAADPWNLLNPGKIVNVSPMDRHMRYSRINYVNTWDPIMDFSQNGDLTGVNGLIAAVEQCNGAGVCRKHHGFMCPSFQVTREEMHSTRGRANLLREMIYGSFPSEDLAIDSVYGALDLCLACKGCKVECPSSVDMAKLKYEFMNHYFDSGNNHRKVRDYIFGYIDKFSHLFYPFAPLINLLLRLGVLKSFGDFILGISMQRDLPKLSNRPFTEKYVPLNKGTQKDGVILLLDTYNRYFFPDVGRAAFELLQTLNYDVFILPINGGGRTLLSKGFLNSARKHAKTLVEEIYNLDPSCNYPIIGIEPSEIYMLKDELKDLCHHDNRVIEIGQRALMIDEFLIRPDADGEPRIRKLANMVDCSGNQGVEIYVHEHCYQKAQPPAEDGYPIGGEATVRMLEHVGYKVNIIDDGCCGMAGAFGYESEHYHLSMNIGELALFPAVRRAVKDYGEKAIITTAGISCQAQIKDGTSVKAIHPISLIINQ